MAGAPFPGLGGSYLMSAMGGMLPVSFGATAG